MRLCKIVSVFLLQLFTKVKEMNTSEHQTQPKGFYLLVIPIDSLQNYTFFLLYALLFFTILAFWPFVIACATHHWASADCCSQTRCLAIIRRATDFCFCNALKNCFFNICMFLILKTIQHQRCSVQKIALLTLQISRKWLLILAEICLDPYCIYFHFK